VGVVVTVSVSVGADELLMVTEVEPRLHVAGLAAPAGPETVQLSFTAPVNPPEGVAVMIEVFAVVAPPVNASEAGEAERENVEEELAELHALTRL
jgi:hypothetical protein